MYDVVNNLKPDLLIRASMVNSNLLFPQVNLRNQYGNFLLTTIVVNAMIHMTRKVVIMKNKVVNLTLREEVDEWDWRIA